MIKTCDDCQKDFDMFKEGHGSEFNFVLCGQCWSTELKRREIGGRK